jgi:hypothetical protein
LRFDRYDAGSETAKGRSPVADVRADVEDEITRIDEHPLKRVHLGARGVWSMIEAE